MNTSVKMLLRQAYAGGYAVGAFNVYNLEGALAVAAAAEVERSPAILQLHPAALRHGGEALASLCLTRARRASVPLAVHLDHSTNSSEIRSALTLGIESVMADGSALPFADNVAFTRQVTDLAHQAGACVEAELGRLSGTEDGATVAARKAKMTDPDQANDFVRATNIDMLAVCIGNIHGPYTREPRLDFGRLAAIRERVSLPLVLHGASGLPVKLIRNAIQCGVAKFNVNTEIRAAYIGTLRQQLQNSRNPDVLDLMGSVFEAMQSIVVTKLRLFGASGKAVSRSS